MRVGDRVRARNYSDSLVNGLIHRHQHLSAASRWLEQSAASATNGVHVRSLAGAPALRRFRSTRPSARAPRAALARLRRRLQRRLAIKQHFTHVFNLICKLRQRSFCFQLLLFLRSPRRRRSWIRPALRRRGWMSRRSRLRPSSRLAATNKNILQQFVLYPHRLFFSGERRPRRAHHSPQCAHRAAAGGSAGSSAGHDQTQLKYLAMFILMCCRCSKESF